MESRMSQQESLSLIINMIEQAKGNFKKGGGKYFVLWGYVVALASLAHFFIFITPSYAPAHPYVWPVACAVGLGITIYYIIRDRNTSVVKTYVGYILNRIWIAFGIAVVIIYTIFLSTNGLLIYPAISLVYIMSLFLSASAFKLKWMYVPVAVCIGCMLLYKFLPVGYQPLIMASMMIAGNIVPGHILNIKGRGNV